MTKLKNSLCCFVLLAFALPTPVLLAQASLKTKQVKTVRLLTVGNSFSQNATHYLGDLTKAAGNILIHHQAPIGGATMAQHWEKAQQHEKDPQDKRGFYGTGRSLKQELLSERWDFVTIQQASIRSHDVSSYRPYASELCAYIKKSAPRADVLVHQTWAYRCDDPRFSAKSSAPGEPATQEAMYQGLTQAYKTIALELGSRLIPVGEAFHLADTDSVWGYKPDAKYDFKNAIAPALPSQTHSLHVGWQWRKQENGELALGMDGHHAGIAGEYLGACVFYEVLFGSPAIGNSFIPRGLDPAYARFLQETAHRAVLNSQPRERSIPPLQVPPK